MAAPMQTDSHATRGHCVPLPEGAHHAELVERVARHEERKEGPQPTEDGVGLLRLGPRVRADAVRLVLLEAGNLNLHRVEEGLRRFALGAGRSGA